MEQRKKLKSPEAISGNGNGNGVSRAAIHSLKATPEINHMPDRYDDLATKFNPLLFSSLERHLPDQLLNWPRDLKGQYMTDVLLRYAPKDERERVRHHEAYKQKIMSTYQCLNRELYTMSPADFFLPSFLAAINGNTKESFREIISEPIPGVLTFDMFQPQFCEFLLSEVEHFERWIHQARFKIMRPNTLNKFGIILDDIGMEGMLEKLRNDFIKPMGKVFFPEVGGATLDSHHGFIVEYGSRRDTELGLHVDDSEVTLNVCLGKQFSGGELFFRGTRCDKHYTSECHPEEPFDYPHVPGRAVLHRGCHRHGARPTTSGRRVNLLVWCRSSIFRELKKYQTDSSSYCGQCQRKKRERQQRSIEDTKRVLMSRTQGRCSS